MSEEQSSLHRVLCTCLPRDATENEKKRVIKVYTHVFRRDAPNPISIRGRNFPNRWMIPSEGNAQPLERNNARGPLNQIQ